MSRQMFFLTAFNYVYAAGGCASGNGMQHSTRAHQRLLAKVAQTFRDERARVRALSLT